MHHRSLSLLALTAVGAVALASPLVTTATATATAATTTTTAADVGLGETAETDTACGDGALTAFQTGSPGWQYTAATDGVITSWQVRGGEKESTRTFKVGRLQMDEILVVGSGPSGLTVPAGAVVTQDVRVPVQSGDFLGFAIDNDARCATTAPAGDYSHVAFAGDLATGTRLAPGYIGDLKLDVAATVEPDADADGFGDTTQDLCPSQAGTQGVCREAAAAPDTTVTGTRVGRVKARTGRAQVVVGFTAAAPRTRFTCSVDAAPAKPCRNPLVVRLAPGRHTVAVTAVDAAGRADPTPARVTVRVKARR